MSRGLNIFNKFNTGMPMDSGVWLLFRQIIQGIISSKKQMISFVLQFNKNQFSSIFTELLINKSEIKQSFLMEYLPCQISDNTPYIYNKNNK
jgi:hypothetical protein